MKTVVNQTKQYGEEAKNEITFFFQVNYVLYSTSSSITERINFLHVESTYFIKYLKSQENTNQVNGQHDFGEIQDEEIKRYMMKVPVKMCQKVSTADGQKALGLLKGWKKSHSEIIKILLLILKAYHECASFHKRIKNQQKNSAGFKDVRMCYEIEVRAIENQGVFYAVHTYLVKTWRG